MYVYTIPIDTISSGSHLFNVPRIVDLGNVVIHIISIPSSILCRGLLLRNRFHRDVFIGARFRIWRRQRNGRVRDPRELDLAYRRDSPGSEDEFLSLEAFFEGDDYRVGVFGVGFDGFVFAHALQGMC